MSVMRRVYRELLRDVERGVFLPGEHLVEQELARRYDTSRPTIRSVLQELDYDRLVSRTPNSGVRIREVNVDDIEDSVQVLAALGELTASLATRRITPDQHGQLLELAESSVNKLRSGRIDVFHEPNEFQEFLRSLAQSPALTHSVRSLHVPLLRHGALEATTVEEQSQLVQGQHEVAQAIMSHQPEEAGLANRRHILAAGSILARLVIGGRKHRKGR